jgi:tetratricopeptide (TPR) repeat protein
MDPDTAGTLDELACLLQEKRDYTGAETLFRQALAVTIKRCGDMSYETAIKCNNLAVLLQDMGDYANAEPLARRAVEIWERLSLASHPDFPALVKNLTDLLTHLHRKPDPSHLLSRGDFLAALKSAKYILRSATRSALSIEGFLAGVLSACERDPLWGEELRRWIDQDVETQLRGVAAADHLEILAATDGDETSMPLDAPFKQLVGAHLSSSLERFVRAALEERNAQVGQ